ncbi:hypothetical protein EXS65_01520 [Candidatus Peribacteria bacterium]|nr:hypothetical protein [Candidatus Peribacteria bacterium]
MPHEIHHWSSGDYAISTFGKGTPTVACLGGLAYAPSDFHEVAKQLPGTAHIINNPIHTGAVARSTEWQKNLRGGYARVLNETNADYILGHSCGGFDAINISDDIASLKGLIMLTPPYGLPGNADEGRRTEFGLLDRCLAGLCEDMPDELYEQMIDDHAKEYGARVKDIYRHEIPKGREVVANILERMRSSRVPILVILGSKDPWNLQGDFPFLGNHVSQRRIDNSHYPQRSNPEGVSTIATEWIANVQNKIGAPSEVSTTEKPYLTVV